MDYSDINFYQTNQIVPRYEYSDTIAFRRKALFPVEGDDGNSDLGPMSPLSDTTSADSDAITTYKHFYPTCNDHFDDYIVLSSDTEELRQHEKERINISDYNATLCDTPSSTNLNITIIDSPSLSSDVTMTEKYPISPSSSLKTPHDTSTSNSKLPRLSRKSYSEDVNAGDASPSSGEEHGQKIEGSNTKPSKVRTALFPELEPVSAKSFYPKVEVKKLERSFTASSNNNTKKSKSKSKPLYLCNRQSRRRNRFGAINAGVSHKIRKPKKKKIAKLSLKQALMNKEVGSQIVEYIQDLNNLNANIEKQIQPIKEPPLTINELKDDNKENESTEITCNKKFFTTIGTKKATSQKENNTTQKTVSQKSAISDLIDEFENDLPKLDLDSIIKSLDDDPNESERIVLTASSKVNDSYDSIMLHCAANSKPPATYKDRKRKLVEKESSIDTMLSPTSQMCDMASGLAINSPKRAKLNFNKVLENTENLGISITNVFNNTSSSSAMEQKKLFPIFYQENKSVVSEVKKDNAKQLPRKKLARLAPDQMLIDAGQKKFGLTQCTECEVVYNSGDPDDEEMHLNYHNASHILKFTGWKNENVVGRVDGTRIIKVSPGDSKIWLKRVTDLMGVVNRDLGYYDQTVDFNHCIAYLCIKNKSIAGCIMAELKTEAFKMLSSIEGIDLCSEEPYPIKCGISRIWVSHQFRRQGIGSHLMDCLRKNFMYGYILKLEDIAMSSPTDAGKLFATSYFMTPNFLIYTY